MLIRFIILILFVTFQKYIYYNTSFTYLNTSLDFFLNILNILLKLVEIQIFTI